MAKKYKTNVSSSARGKSTGSAKKQVAVSGAGADLSKRKSLRNA